MIYSVVKNTAHGTSKKKLTNHITSVEKQWIIQVTTHASEKALNNDEGSEKNSDSMPPQSEASSSFPGVLMWSFPTTTSTCEQVNTSGRAFPTDNFHNRQVTFNVIRGNAVHQSL